MKHPFTLPVLLVLLATSATLAQNKIITPAQQPLVVGNAGLQHAALNASSPTAPWNGKVLSLDANGLMILVKDSAGGSGSTLWNVSGSHINYLPGNVGIGTATPLQRLHVNGDINVSTGSAYRINNSVFLLRKGVRNTLLGFNVAPIVSGTDNFFLGDSTGYANTVGSLNIFIGNNTGRSNISGIGNVFLGTFAGRNSNANNNLFIGYSVGADNTSGGNNTFIGAGSGRRNLAGAQNTYIGHQSGFENNIGERNTFIGANAGYYNTGSLNTAIGYNVNIIQGISNSTAIGSNATVTSSNSIVLGATGGNQIKVGIGNTAPTARLHVTAGGTTATGVRFENLPTSTGTVYPLYVDANGNVMKASTAGARALAAGESNWERTAQDHLLNRNGGGVLIGSGFKTLPTGYQLYVSEGILTERVKVALKSTDEWRDNVFRDDYMLRSLDEMEAFIKQHRHLPGVPSAEEMVKQGNDLHRTDALLLEKIEEQALYLLEVKKENRSLKTRTEEMMSLIRQLSQEVESLKQELQNK
ncbi:hypothetical protein GCM10027275_10310 [Rhabdobacter roseus]|uniref:TMF family protein n=1 Tax=Rhabdobacter roseus TaxID=1655419 RepID=A0A840TTD5_9BACT|nr:hypothetical protein [Rhabdobacter roseus]MBB5282939.1 hypothetical protein [Rhabdobacter roseus]